MTNLIKANNEHANWYNKFYKNDRTDFPSWYTFMLPELMKQVKSDSKILELGCGQGKGLKYIVNKSDIKEENIFGIGQSSTAIEFAKIKLPTANLKQGDIYSLEYADNTFDFILLMEVIEHLENPMEALKEAYRVLKPKGALIISFPNYLNFPWLIVRILSEKLNRPNWIVLQPVDKIYTTLHIIELCKKTNFQFQKIIGSNYFPPIFYVYENKKITTFFNKFKLNHLSFHPILFFKK